MRKSFILLPIMFIVCLFCGCGKGELDDFFVEFSCPEIITMKIGTADVANEMAVAPLICNFDLDECVLEYDEEIINYDPKTGLIVALKSGKTRIKVTAKDVTDVVDVVVEQAIYCDEISLNNLDKIYMGTNPEIKPIVNPGYNMGFEYVVYNEEILSISEDGIITPLCEGETLIRVNAIAGVGFEMGSRYTTKKVTVLEERKSLHISILNENFKEVKSYKDEFGIVNYDLYNNNLNEIMYILKIESEQSLDSCYECKENVLNEDAPVYNWVYNYVIDKVSSECVMYKPFKVVGFGESNFYQQRILDVGVGYSAIIDSNIIQINAYKQFEEGDMDIFVFKQCEEGLIQQEKIDNYYLLNIDDVMELEVFISHKCNSDKIYCGYYNIDLTIKDGLIVKPGEGVGLGYLRYYSYDGGDYEYYVYFYNNVLTESIELGYYDEEIEMNEYDVALFYVDYVVKDFEGITEESQSCYLEFYNQDGEVIEFGKDVIGNFSLVNGTLAVDFLKKGIYSFRIVSELGYVSRLIVIEVVDDGGVEF